MNSVLVEQETSDQKIASAINTLKESFTKLQEDLYSRLYEKLSGEEYYYDRVDEWLESVIHMLKDPKLSQPSIPSLTVAVKKFLWHASKSFITLLDSTHVKKITGSLKTLEDIYRSSFASMCVDGAHEKLPEIVYRNSHLFENAASVVEVGAGSNTAMFARYFLWGEYRSGSYVAKSSVQFNIKKYVAVESCENLCRELEDMASIDPRLEVVCAAWKDFREFGIWMKNGVPTHKYVYETRYDIVILRDTTLFMNTNIRDTIMNALFLTKPGGYLLFYVKTPGHSPSISSKEHLGEVVNTVGKTAKNFGLELLSRQGHILLFQKRW